MQNNGDMYVLDCIAAIVFVKAAVLISNDNQSSRWSIFERKKNNYRKGLLRKERPIPKIMLYIAECLLSLISVIVVTPVLTLTYFDAFFVYIT